MSKCVEAELSPLRPACLAAGSAACAKLLKTMVRNTKQPWQQPQHARATRTLPLRHAWIRSRLGGQAQRLSSKRSEAASKPIGCACRSAATRWMLFESSCHAAPRASPYIDMHIQAPATECHPRVGVDVSACVVGIPCASCSCWNSEPAKIRRILFGDCARLALVSRAMYCLRAQQLLNMHQGPWARFNPQHTNPALFA